MKMVEPRKIGGTRLGWGRGGGCEYMERAWGAATWGCAHPGRQGLLLPSWACQEDWGLCRAGPLAGLLPGSCFSPPSCHRRGQRSVLGPG